MPRRSAGLLLYRRTREGDVEVLLAHPGGPAWANRDLGAWTVPKGEFDAGEEEGLAVARREFEEETGHPPPDGAAIELGEIRQKAGKRVIGFALEGDFEPADILPGTFELEWPPRSGRRQAFPEVDRVAWFDLATAAAKIVRGQVALLERLAQLRAGS